MNKTEQKISDYREGDGAEELTSLIRLTDDGANLESAAVKISSGYVEGEDVLDFTATPSLTDSGQDLRYGTSYDNSWDVKLGDFDGDGDLDAFEANYNEGNRVWLNDGSGSFTDSGQNLNQGGSYNNSSGVDLADLDGDGDLDALVANEYDYSKVWLNNGAGVFSYTSQNIDHGHYSYDVELADFDGDGDMDAFFANYHGQSNRVWLNDGSGSFTHTQNLGSRYSYDVE
ncbi:uncharacterized protein METZ01_LOCUS442268, partial [marine metagenome]